MQVTLGAVVAHYTVEGQEFYGIDISQYFPYSLVRTWHIQAALFWIAMAFLAGGLSLHQSLMAVKIRNSKKLGVDVLYWALVVLVVGSFTGSYLAIAHILPEEWSFMFGHQGYEFIDLGRFWQAVKFAGILFWLVLMLRGTVNAFKQPGDKNLLAIILRLSNCDRFILWPCIILWRAYSHFCDGILALVGSSPMGRRLL